MAFRCVMIESPARISVKNRQLVVATDAERSLSPEDISALLIENRNSVISAAALSLLARHGCAVYVCDERHLPCAVLTPFASHSRELGVLKDQLELGEVLKKHLWQSIVKAKIVNQARCLRFCGKEDVAAGLENMADSVRSGDPGNVEAAAARRYFIYLFDEDFSRRSENDINAALNYGYAVVRGAAARSLAVHGLLPALGLHHKNELNNFNLADDLMEPFRPVVDLLVRSALVDDEEEGLTPGKKRLLFNVLNLDVKVEGKRLALSRAMDRLAAGLAAVLGTGQGKLPLPELLELRQHTYE